VAVPARANREPGVEMTGNQRSFSNLLQVSLFMYKSEGLDQLFHQVVLPLYYGLPHPVCRQPQGHSLKPYVRAEPCGVCVLNLEKISGGFVWTRCLLLIYC
jgi:hypothetical protein